METDSLMTTSELTLTICQLCSKKNACLSTSSDICKKLRLFFMVCDIGNVKSPSAFPNGFTICMPCLVFLTTTSDYQKDCTGKQKTIHKKIAKFYGKKSYKEIWNCEEAEPLPNLKFAPCQLCGKWNASILAFSEFGLNLKIPQKVEKILGIELISNERYSPPVCLGCMVKLNNISEQLKIIRKTLKKLNEEPSKSALETGSSKAFKQPTVRAEATATCLNNQNVNPPEAARPQVFEESKVEAASTPNTDLEVEDPEYENLVFDWTYSPNNEAEAPPITTSTLPPSIKPEEEDTSESVPFPATDDSEQSSGKKERKTICVTCKKWINRSLMEDHEKFHKDKLEVLLD